MLRKIVHVAATFSMAVLLSAVAPVFGGTPEVLRTDNIYTTATALCPNSVVAANGDIIVTFADHGDVQFGCKSLFVRSSDGGKTWSDVYLEMVPEDPSLTGVMVTGLVRLPNNDILALRHDLHMPNQALNKRYTGSLKILRSTDNGESFEHYSDLPYKEGSLSAPYGSILILGDGALIMPGFVERLGNGYWLSRDEGKTWGEFQIVWKDPPNGSNRALNFNETAYVLAEDGTIVSVARNDVNKVFYVISSSDNGATWTEPKPINVTGGSPALHRSANGTLLLAYRDASRLGLGISESTDNGKTWRYAYRLPIPEGIPAMPSPHWERLPVEKGWQHGEGYVGYPDFVDLPDGNIYAVWHLHNKAVPPAAPGRDTFGLVGNLISNPADENNQFESPVVYPRALTGAILRGQEKTGVTAAASLLDAASDLGLQITPLRIENRRGNGAEVHASEDDIFYVLAGEATFHLGGTLSDVREYSPGNQAGESQQGETAYPVVAGDLIVIPHGVPHRITCPDGFVELLVIKRLEK